MNWRIVLATGATGLMMGVSSLFGLTQGIEFWLWLIIAIVIAFWIARKLKEKLFVHGLLGGLASGIVNSIIQVLWLDTYRAHNPSSVQDFHQLPGNVDERVFVMIAGVVIGVLYGVMLGAFSWLAGLVMKRTVPTGGL